jgi:hypothetical protein
MRALIILFAAVIAGIAFVSLGIKTHNLNARFDGTVTRVEGEIDELGGIGGAPGSIARKPSVTWTVTYRYDAPDGTHQATDSISSETWDILHKSPAIPVKYLTGNPVECRIDLPSVEAGYRAEVWIDFAAGFLLLTLGCIVYWKSHHGRNP